MVFRKEFFENIFLKKIAGMKNNLGGKELNNHTFYY